MNTVNKDRTHEPPSRDLLLEFSAMALAVTRLLERGERLSHSEALAQASARIGRRETHRLHARSWKDWQRLPEVREVGP